MLLQLLCLVSLSGLGGERSWESLLRLGHNFLFELFARALVVRLASEQSLRGALVAQFVLLDGSQFVIAGEIILISRIFGGKTAKP